MLALETGWTPDVLAELPQRFRAACHWALFGRAIVGPEGFPDTTIPQGVDPKVIAGMLRLRKDVDAQRAMLFPEDADGDA